MSLRHLSLSEDKHGSVEGEHRSIAQSIEPLAAQCHGLGAFVDYLEAGEHLRWANHCQLPFAVTLALSLATDEASALCHDNNDDNNTMLTRQIFCCIVKATERKLSLLLLHCLKTSPAKCCCFVVAAEQTTRKQRQWQLLSHGDGDNCS